MGIPGHKRSPSSHTHNYSEGQFCNAVLRSAMSSQGSTATMGKCTGLRVGVACCLLGGKGETAARFGLTIRAADSTRPCVPHVRCFSHQHAAPATHGGHEHPVAEPVLFRHLELRYINQVADTSRHHGLGDIVSAPRDEDKSRSNESTI